MAEKRAIVTGAYGFLGRYVARVLSDEGYLVTGIGHGTWLRSEWQQWGLSEWHSCAIDMNSLNNYVKQPDIVIHCAGSGSVGYSLTHPMQDFERTVLTSLILLEFFRLHSPKTLFVYPSSAAVYGNVDTFPITESTPLRPISPYGVHKKIVEEIILSYAKSFSIPVAIARFFSLYGPGLRKQLLWDTCTKIDKGKNEFYGTGQEIRDWLHVQDAARLLHTLSLHASSDPIIVNGGTGVGISVNEIVSLLFKKMNKKDIPHFSQIRKPGDPSGYVADIEKILNFGWNPKISLDNGLNEYITWYQSGAP